MLFALASEATAAILGALAGGLIAFVGQGLVMLVGARNARRTAAAMIFAELVGNYANATAAVEIQGWPSTKPEAQRAAWDIYGGRLLRPWHRPHDIGHVATAYNRVDDVAWLAGRDALEHDDHSRRLLAEIGAGMYVVGRLAGYSDAELRDREIPVDDARALIESGMASAAASRRSSRKPRP